MYAYIPAKDMARARQFYEEKVGFKATQQTNGGVVYAFGKGTAAFLYPTPNAGTSLASQAFWSVADVDSEIRALQGRGVVFEHYSSDDMPGERSPAGAITAGGAKAAWFKDSEGNIMALIENLASAP
jgi:catechol 2,3-dioxygenase-like lactoylglutathione lyase family enzyme